ncbi:hypothetical protein GJ700_30060, partial [Duganella sp. FT92W]|nr:hypothetical protein [Pseudoduganella rivuli]
MIHPFHVHAARAGQQRTPRRGAYHVQPAERPGRRNVRAPALWRRRGGQP